MLALSNAPALSVQEAELLQNLSNQVARTGDFAAQCEQAKTLWGTKGGAEGKRIFDTIRQHLAGLPPKAHLCAYCEGSEASDIEHVYPKSFFPERCFRWDNYLLACKLCNSGYKLDKCWLYEADGQRLVLSRGQEPPHSNLAMINPRTEDPANYLRLNLQYFTFELLAGLSPAESQKARSTLEILKLNERDFLLEDRPAVHENLRLYFAALRRFLACQSLSDLAQAFEDEGLDLAQDYPDQDLETIKTVLKTKGADFLRGIYFPSVWTAIKTQQPSPFWLGIFRDIPEALDW